MGKGYPMRIKSFFALLIIFFLCFGIAQSEQKRGFVPPSGFVPDERTAVAIAEAVLIPIYGKEQINSEKPLMAKLKDGIWTVQGSLPKGWDGGVAILKLAKQDARIIYVMHGQ
jgi:hypothetical protein